jgi:hypothetical protein
MNQKVMIFGFFRIESAGMMIERSSAARFLFIPAPAGKRFLRFFVEIRQGGIVCLCVKE